MTAAAPTTPVKYQVFISSTFVDLRKERVAVLNEVLRHDHIPAGMELFPAGDEDSWEVIRKTIDMCDIYVVLVGARYGSTVQDENGNRVSFTEREFNYARKRQKLILAFVLGEDSDSFEAHWTAAATKYPKEKDLHAQLIRFRNAVREIDDKRERLVGFFEKPTPKRNGKKARAREYIQRLKSDFAHAFVKLIQNNESRLTGWVKADADLIKLGRVHDDPFIRPILDRLREFTDLRDRNLRERDVKAIMAECFWVHFGKAISDSSIAKVFFESGSTLTYLSTRLRIGAVPGEREDESRTVVSSEFRTRLEASTNGILTYFDNLFFPDKYRFRFSLWPSGRPEGKFGATFGDMDVVANDPINDTDRAYIADKRREACERDVLFVTASGLNLTDSRYPFGPHVGSFSNKVFKIALLTADVPKIYFMDSSKIDAKIKPHCRFVAEFVDEHGSEQSWKGLSNSQPMALCIGVRNRKKKKKHVTVQELKKRVSEAMGWRKSFVIKHFLFDDVSVWFTYNDLFQQWATLHNLPLHCDEASKSI